MAGFPDALIDRALKVAVDRATHESPRALELLGALAGRRLGIEVSGAPWITTLESTGTALRAERADANAAHDALIIGSPLSLLALSTADAEAAQAAIQRGDVRITGDAQIAQQFRELLALLRPDLEALLGEVLGRSSAHVLMRGLRAAQAWTRSTVWTGVQNIGEYLAHERGDLVSRAEAEHFLRGVDELRERFDRIEARTAQLERQTGQHAGGAGGQEPA